MNSQTWVNELSYCASPSNGVTCVGVFLHLCVCSCWYRYIDKLNLQILIPASSKGFLFGSKGWYMRTPYHPFSTLWKIQVAKRFHEVIHHRSVFLHFSMTFSPPCCLSHQAPEGDVETVVPRPVKWLFYGVSLANVFIQGINLPWKMNGWNLQPSPMNRKEKDLKQSSMIYVSY